MLLPRRATQRLLAAVALTFIATAQKEKATTMPPTPHDEKILQAYYDADTKYRAAPVPTPLDRAAAITFVNTRANRATPPDKLRKLMRLAVFYNLQETAAAFSSVLTGSERQQPDVLRSALCLVALAWIGDPGQQANAERYYRMLQDRADIDRDKNIMLEVVGAFGPRVGTSYHRQWIQGGMVALQRRLLQEQADHNVPGAKLVQEKINALTEYLNIQLAFVDRAFSIRQRIEATAPPSGQIQPLVAYSLATMADSTPQLSNWASMRLLRLDATLRALIEREFYRASSGRAGANPGADLIRARALRAAEYFGYSLPEPDRAWLAGQPDTGTDPLVLRPGYYMD